MLGRCCKAAKTAAGLTMRSLAIILCALLSGCVSYKIDSGTKVPPGKTYPQALSEQAGCVGAAVAVKSDDLDRQKAVQRWLFKDCMTRLGYRVTTPVD